MTLKKTLTTLAAAVTFAGPASATTAAPSSGFNMTTGVMGVLMGLLLPAVQAAREAARR